MNSTGTLRLGGVSVDEWRRQGAALSDLRLYLPLDPREVEKEQMEVHHYGYYHRWRPQDCYYYAVENSEFMANPDRTEGTFSKYSSLDDKIDGFHYFTTYIKFGIGRTTYEAAQEIRNHHISREEAVMLVRKYDGEFPKKYFREFLEYIADHNDEFVKNKSLVIYKFLIEKIAELKFTFGEFLREKEIFSKSPYLIYLYAFLILFTFGIGIGILRNNFKNSIKNGTIEDKPLVSLDENKKNIESETVKKIKKPSLNYLKSEINEPSKNNSSRTFPITTASPSLEEIRNLINAWLQSKSNYLAGKSEINLSMIVRNGLINRTIEERQDDIKKGIYKEINSQIRKIDLESQTSSRIVVLVELNYLERIIKNSGEFVNETSLIPLKVKYILGFSNNSWKLVDFVSGL